MTFILAFSIIAVVVAGSRLAIGLLDRSKILPTPPIPERLDPLEIALLRSGRGDVLRAELVGLQSRGLLTITSDSVSAGPRRPDLGECSALDAAVLGALDEPKRFGEIAKAVGPQLTTALEPTLARLRRESLLVDPGAHGTSLAIRFAAVALLAICGYSLIAHAAGLVDRPVYDHPALLGMLFFFGVIVALSPGRGARLTDRGRRYLERLTMGFPEPALRREFAPLPETTPVPAGVGAFAMPETAVAAGLAAAPLLVGLYGVAALENTPYADASTHMKPRRPDGSGGCSMSYDGGGSCGCCGGGSHGGCGGSCSGGCGGGCGGGGCGG